MRFIIGFLIGVALGSAAAILLAPARPQEGEKGWQAPSSEGGPEAGASEDHDLVAPLRRALYSLRERAQEAWSEAAQAAAEAENEMRGRYQRVARKGSAGRE